MDFGYLKAYSSLSLNQLRNVSTVTPTSDQVLEYVAATNSWKLAFLPGDVVGPSSNDPNAVALYDGTTGKLLKSDAEFTYDASTDTLYTTNITRTGTGNLDISASTTVATDLINITLPDSDSQGVLTLNSGADTDDNFTGSQLKLETPTTEPGRITLTSGANSASPSVVNQVILNGTVGDININSAANSYIGFETQAATNAAGGTITLAAGTNSSTGNSGVVNLLAGFATGSGINGGSVNITGGGRLLQMLTKLVEI